MMGDAGLFARGFVIAGSLTTLGGILAVLLNLPHLAKKIA
jgi:hypothetical protein